MSASSSPDDIVVRPLASADIHAIRQLHSSILSMSYPLSFFLQLLLLPARLCLVAHPRSDPQQFVGFVSAALAHSPDLSAPLHMDQNDRIRRIEILTLGVIPTYQHRGLARRLIRTITQSLCTLTVESICLQANVATSNTSALKFYERIGLRIASDVISGLYRTCACGSKDGYLVVGCINKD